METDIPDLDWLLLHNGMDMSCSDMKEGKQTVVVFHLGDTKNLYHLRFHPDSTILYCDRRISSRNVGCVTIQSAFARVLLLTRSPIWVAGVAVVSSALEMSFWAVPISVAR